MRRWRQGWGARVLLVLGAFALVLGVASVLRRWDTPPPNFGAAWIQSAGGAIAVAVEPDSPASDAGLLVGDRLVRAGDRSVDTALDAAQLGWLIVESGATELTVERAGRLETLRVAPSWRRQGELFIYLAVVGFAFWLSATFVLVRWASARGGQLYPALAYALFGVLAFSHTGAADALDWTIYWADVLCAALVPALLVHLSLRLARRTAPLRKTLRRGAYALSLGVVAFEVWLVAGGAYRFGNPVRALESGERLSLLFLGLALVLSSGLLMHAYHRSDSALHRGQVRWVLWGLGIGLGPAALLQLAPWSLGAPALPLWATFLSTLPVLFVPAAFTVALARYRLHDLDLLLIRVATEISALFCTFAIYAVAVFLLREGIDEWLTLSVRATRYIGFVVAAIAYPQLRTVLRIGLERAFYRKRYSYRTTLLDWARALNEETDLASLLQGVRGRIRATLGVPQVEVLFREGSDRFAGAGLETDEDTIAIRPETVERLESRGYVEIEPGRLSVAPWARHLFALRVKGELRALLAVAERRPPEEPLSTEDRSLIATLAEHAGSAIETARLVREVRQGAEENERLHAREDRLLDSSAVGLLLVDGDGRVLACNRALETMYGATRREVVGRRAAEILPLDVAQRIEREASPDRETRLYRVGVVNRRGERLTADIALSAPEKDGSRVMTIDDVGERIRLEEKLLRQERLAALGLLAAGVAHEINTPLTGISSYAQLIAEDDALQAGHRDLLTKIENQTERASRITRSLLDLARPGEAVHMPIDLNAVATEIHNLFEPQVRGTSIRLTLDLDEGLPEVSGDRNKIQQVLLNLLLNARDSVGDEGTIELATRRRAGAVEIEVSDDGPGIPEADRSRVFDPFFTTKVGGKGTGLGLSICDGIMREHGGELTLDARTETGADDRTRFRATFPLPARAASAGG